MVKIVVIVALLTAAAAIVTVFIDIASQLIRGAVFLPTPRRVMAPMLAMAKIRRGETVYDLGCGDARLVIAANQRYGARAIGIEISPFIYCLAVINAWLHRADVTLLRGNALTRSYADADVIFCYLLPDMLQVLATTLIDVKPGCRIICHQFEMPGWTPVAKVSRECWSGAVDIYKYQV